MYCCIVNALHCAALNVIPVTRANCTADDHNIPGWNDLIKAAHADARDAFKFWVASSKPRQREEFDSMRFSRAKFKYLLRHSFEIVNFRRRHFNHHAFSEQLVLCYRQFPFFCGCLFFRNRNKNLLSTMFHVYLVYCLHPSKHSTSGPHKAHMWQLKWLPPNGTHVGHTFFATVTHVWPTCDRCLAHTWPTYGRQEAH